MTASSSNTQSHTSMTAASSFRPIEGRSVSNNKPKAEKKKGAEKEKKAKPKGKEKAEPHIPTIFLGRNPPSGELSHSKKPLDEYNPDEDIDDESDDDQSLKGDEEEGMVVANLTSLVDVKKKSKSKSARPGSGRPANTLMNNLVQQCYHKSRPEKPLYRCRSSCGTTYASRNLSRIVRHAIGCGNLPAELRREAKAHAANQAPSRKLAIDDPESTKVRTHENGTDSTEAKNEAGSHVVAVLKKRKAEETDWFEEAKKLGRAERHRKLNLAVVKLICCSGIPSYISDLDVWKGVFAYADPTYRPASRAKLEEIDIIGEAESVDEIQLAYLRTQENITVSCDGGTTKGREAFWTLHMSTAERKVFLMDVREATAVSHTAVWIKTFVLEV
jgi:hypothetical protein